MVRAFAFDKQNRHVFLKFVASSLLLGLAFRLFLSDSSQISSSAVEEEEHQTSPEETPQDLPFKDRTQVFDESFSTNRGVPSVDIPEELKPINQTSEKVSAKCDIFTGDWILDPSGPIYTSKSCLFIEDHQNCIRNGRPDSKYLYWRWKPRDCELPRFDSAKFLEKMRNKSLAFIGDSISRNHVQSLLCMLSQVEQAVEVYHDEEYRSKRWHFPSHNFTLSVLWTPFLIKAEVFEDNDGVSSAETQLHLDKMDKKWSEQYKNFDHVIFAGGKWFLKTAIYYDNNTILGCHNCAEKNVTKLGFEFAYRKALQVVLRFITKSEHKAFVFFRTTTPDHFENGEWFSGGTCNRTVPFKNGEIGLKDVDSAMRTIELEEFEMAQAEATEKGVNLKLLDSTYVSLLRPDGHPGPYRMHHPFANNETVQIRDCLHWCLPGPIDSWNDLLMALLQLAALEKSTTRTFVTMPELRSMAARSFSVILSASSNAAAFILCFVNKATLSIFETEFLTTLESHGYEFQPVALYSTPSYLLAWCKNSVFGHSVSLFFIPEKMTDSKPSVDNVPLYLLITAYESAAS